MADQVWLPSFYVFKKGFWISFDVFVFEGLVGPTSEGFLAENELVWMCVRCGWQNDFLEPVDVPFLAVFLYFYDGVIPIVPRIDGHVSTTSSGGRGRLIGTS